VEQEARSGETLGTGRIGRLLVTAIVAVACAGAIAACGSSGSQTGSSTASTYLDVARVERSIQRSIRTQRHLAATVACPTRVLQKPGKFACIATTYSAKKPHRKIQTPFLVTIANSKGYVTYVGR
jgi:hypothetical protein